jgi:glyceraldehyde-3-phosphate dehydrogenase/erythrose-4-phosphate dehydrogenase
MKVAINGFGRIGRHSFKFLLANPDIEVVQLTTSPIIKRWLTY